ncbi:MAG: hypothetical protein V4577_13515 [Bacteroidota bacterium]
MKKKKLISYALSLILCTSAAAQAPSPEAFNLSSNSFANFGKKYGMVLINNMPYVKLTVGKADGLFVLDFGSNISSIDTNNFDCGVKPIGTVDPQKTKLTVDNFDFYGAGFYFWFRPSLANLSGMKQAGLLGTDAFMANVYTLNYAGQAIYQSYKANFPDDNFLKAAGFKPASTAKHYSNSFANLEDPQTTFNIPTVPVKIGTVQALAQVDPGFNDGDFYHSININEALYQALVKANIPLNKMTEQVNPISSCGGNEPVVGYQLGKGYTFSVTCTDGSSVLVTPDVFLFVKHAPADVLKACGGVGAWSVPGAQFGASFLKQTKVIVFDPFSSLVWFYTK